MSFARKTSAGVLYPRHLRGVALRRSQIDLKYRFVNAVGSDLRGRYRRSRLLVFSTVPFCHGERGSQNHGSAPGPSFICCHALNSVPRSKVMDWRAWVGKEERLSTRPSMTGLDCLSGFFRMTANRLTRSTNDVMLALPNSAKLFAKHD